MSQGKDTVLCGCFVCKGQYPELGGKFVSISTFRRHRNKTSKWNNSINMQDLNANIDLNVNSNSDNDSEK